MEQQSASQCKGYSWCPRFSIEGGFKVYTPAVTRLDAQYSAGNSINSLSRMGLLPTFHYLVPRTGSLRLSLRLYDGR